MLLRWRYILNRWFQVIVITGQHYYCQIKLFDNPLVRFGLLRNAKQKGIQFLGREMYHRQPTCTYNRPFHGDGRLSLLQLDFKSGVKSAFVVENASHCGSGSLK